MTLDAEIARPVRRLTATPPVHQCRKCAELREELDEWKRAYSELLRGVSDEQDEFIDCRFTRSQRRIMRALVKHTPNHITPLQVCDYVYYDRPIDDQGDMWCIKTFVHHIRRKLRESGSEWSIDTMRNYGYAAVRKGAV